ncbi:1428_t:CDS:2 [Entrophospora sp. SA101]|nr:1428_t:CDS:2 [Entrophospora sp. SA101]
MSQVSILPITTSSTTSLEITPSQVITATTTVPTTVRKTKTINRSQIKTSTVFKDVPTSSVFFCFLGIITYKIRKRLQDKKNEGRESSSFSPTTPQTPNTPSSAGLKERKNRDQTHELQKEVNKDLTELGEKVKAFNSNKPIAESNDNQGGIKVDELEQELDAVKKELANLKEKITEYEKLTDEIGGAVKDIGDKPKQIHEEQKKTKTLVGELSVGVLAIIGTFKKLKCICDFSEKCCKDCPCIQASIQKKDDKINELQQKVLELLSRQKVNISYLETNNNPKLETDVKRLRKHRDQFYQENQELKKQLAEKDLVIISLQEEKKEVWELFEEIKKDSVEVEAVIIGFRVIYKLSKSEETNKKEEEEFIDNRTACQKYLNNLDDKLQSFPKEEVKKGLEKLLNNIKTNSHYPSELQTNKNETVKKLEKILNDIRTRIIYLNQQLTGVLDCQEYKDLIFIFISTSVDSSKLEIKGGSWSDGEETQIILCQLAETYLNQNYPQNGTCQIENEGYELDNFGKTRAEIKKLDISGRGLEGNLDLSDFPNLEYLDCSDNCLTNLNLTNCQKLKTIRCYINQLTTLNLKYLPASLKYFYYDTDLRPNCQLASAKAELGQE